MVNVTVKDWCELFLTCFQLPIIKTRCQKDFYFYKRLFLQRPRLQAFTFEIGTYLSATRIQVKYCPYDHYSFSVNIIHCDSGGWYNGSGTYLIFCYDFLNKNVMLFRVVGQSLKPSNVRANNSQHFVPKRGATMLDPFLQRFRHCWGHSCSLHMFKKSYGLHSFHDALHVPILFGVVASVFQPLPTRTQQLLTLLAPQC